jgi:hypothetical protein
MLHTLHLDTPLPQETDPWPGAYNPNLHLFAEYYSLPGLALIPALVAALFFAIIDIKRRAFRPTTILAILAAPFLLAVVYHIRWMGLMGRFWVAPYALILPIIVIYAAILSTRHRAIKVLCIAAIVITVTLAAIARTIAFTDALTTEINPVGLDEPYFEPLAHIPPGSTILLIAGQGTRDYPLFLPRAGFPNTVIPYGEHPYNFDRFSRLIDDHPNAFVLIEDDRAVDFHWDPPIPTRDFIAHLKLDKRFREIPLPYTPHMRLFTTQAIEN